MRQVTVAILMVGSIVFRSGSRAISASCCSAASTYSHVSTARNRKSLIYFLYVMRLRVFPLCRGEPRRAVVMVVGCRLSVVNRCCPAFRSLAVPRATESIGYAVPSGRRVPVGVGNATWPMTASRDCVGCRRSRARARRISMPPEPDGLESRVPCDASGCFRLELCGVRRSAELAFSLQEITLGGRRSNGDVAWINGTR